MAHGPIARIGGLALAPGTSRNKRLYEKTAIASAVRRAQARIDSGEQPLTMLSHHGASDDSTRIVGRVTKLALDENGAARYEAELADTPHARTILNLIDSSGGQRFLEGVSIRGAWLGPVQHKNVDGTLCEFAEDLELDGLDFTKTPGVAGARVDTVTRTAQGSPRETDDGRVLIFESVPEATAVITEAGEAVICEGAIEEASDPKKPHGDVKYADPGYLSDGKKRYPIDTEAHARAAWNYINQSKNSSKYSADQLKRVKGRIKAALKKFGVNVNEQQDWIVDVDRCVREGVDEAGVSITLDNGMFRMAFDSYQIDPADLDVIARAAMDAACDAVKAIDPDQDGDMDVDGADSEDTDGDGGETAPSEQTTETADVPETADETPQTPTADVAAGDPNESEEEPAMAESTETQTAVTPAADETTEQEQPTQAAVVSFTAEQFTALLAAIKPAPAATESAPEQPVTETQVQESDEDRFKRLVAEGVAAALPEALQNHVEVNGAQRKGLMVSESAPNGSGSSSKQFPDYPEDWPQKPLHEFSTEEQKRYFNPQVEGAVMGRHSAFRQNVA